MSLNHSYIKIKSPVDKLQYLLGDSVLDHYSLYKPTLRQIELHLLPQDKVIKNIKTDSTYLYIFSQAWHINFGLFAKRYLARLGNSYQNYVCELYAMSHDKRIEHLAYNEIFIH